MADNDDHPVHMAMPANGDESATVHQSRVEDVRLVGVQPSIASFAPYLERQGLYIHTFQCLACSLEFALFSWWPDRHTVVNTACPECQRVTQKTHWRADVVTEAGQAFGQGPEIYHYSPVGPDARLMMDSSYFTGLPEEPGEATWPVMEEGEAQGISRPAPPVDEAQAGSPSPLRADDV